MSNYGVFHLDFEYILYQYIRRYEVDIGPGDIIFVPAGAAHQAYSSDQR